MDASSDELLLEAERLQRALGRVSKFVVPSEAAAGADGRMSRAGSVARLSRVGSNRRLTRASTGGSSSKSLVALEGEELQAQAQRLMGQLGTECQRTSCVRKTLSTKSLLTGGSSSGSAEAKFATAGAGASSDALLGSFFGGAIKIEERSRRVKIEEPTAPAKSRAKQDVDLRDAEADAILPEAMRPEVSLPVASSPLLGTSALWTHLTTCARSRLRSW
eukprot:6067684-Prymnesium_polylepis.1